MFWCLWSILYNKLIFRISDSESAYLTIYIGTVVKCIFEHVFENFHKYFKKFKKCPRSVNNFRTDHFVDILGDLGSYFGGHTSEVFTQNFL